MGPRRGRPGPGRASPTTRRTRSGDVVFVRCPRSGTTVEAGGELSEVESTKSVSRHLRPGRRHGRRGQRRAGRRARAAQQDPYGEGWICVIEPADPAEVDALLDAEAYAELIDSDASRRPLGPGSGQVDGYRASTCSATTAGTGTRGVELLLVVRRRRSTESRGRRRSRTDRPSTRPTERRGRRRGRGRRLTRARRRGVGVLVVQAGPERRVPLRARRPRSPGRAATPTATSSSTTSPCRAATPRSRARPRATRSRDVGSLNGTYLNRERIDEAAAAPTATSSRSASSSWCSWPSGGPGELTVTAMRAAPVDRRGAQPAPGGVPRRHDLQDPLPREPGPARPRAHAVGLPQVLRAPTSSACAGSSASSGSTSCR